VSRRNTSAVSAAAERFTAEVEALNKERRRKLLALGKRARKILLPYFIGKRLTYMTGNGDWYIKDTADSFIDDDDLPAEILAVLMVEVGYGDHIGFYVDDIRETDWKDKP
jgi:hypothetical protein